MATELQKSLADQLQELTAKREQILSRSTPLRTQRDEIKNHALAKCRALDLEILAIENGLADIDRDRATIARALGGRRMSDSA